VGVAVGALALGGGGVAAVMLLNSDRESNEATPPETQEEPAQTQDEPADEPSVADVLGRCASPPVIQPAIVSTGDPLQVRLELTSPCAEGDFLASPDWQVRLMGQGRMLAAGTFDLSATPVLIPPGGSSITLEFPASGTWTAGPELGAVSVEAAEASPGAAGLDPASAAGAPQAVTGAPISLEDAEVQTAALQALAAQAAADDPVVRSQMATVWTPQLSSKFLGLEAEGMVWTAQDIWQHYRSLKVRYAQAVLIDSTRWPSYTATQQFWVVGANTPFAQPEGALSWCAQEGWDGDNCFAKYIGMPTTENSTRYQP
jgi:hypothetical protein